MLDLRSTIRLWDFGGECVKIFRGHASYIYSVAAISQSEFASVGEDGCIKIWDLGASRIAQR